MEDEMGESLRLLIVEDEALVLLELEMVVTEAGHEVVGCAMSSGEALARSTALEPDLALVDIHLADGPTGVSLARSLGEHGVPVVFMTANARRIPDDFAGAIGVIAKPYTESGILDALDYLAAAMRAAPAGPPPSSLTLAPPKTRSGSR
jgi:CheY-like chemotaxis protein